MVRVWGRETKHNFVQEVIDNEHLGCWVTICAVHTAVKCSVRHIERGLPNIGKLYVIMQ